MTCYIGSSLDTVIAWVNRLAPRQGGAADRHCRGETAHDGHAITLERVQDSMPTQEKVEHLNLELRTVAGWFHFRVPSINGSQ